MGTCRSLPHSKKHSKMAALNDVDSDNDTQMSTQDNEIPTDTNSNDANANDSNTNNPALNIDNAADNDDAKMKNDDNDDNDTSLAPVPPKYKYTWQWPENDGTWHDYDATTQLLLDQLSIGQKLTIQAGKWTYDITKTSADACSQLNTQTQNARVSRRARVLLSPPTNTNIVQNGNHNWIGNDRYVFLWQFLENDNKWKDLGFNVASKLEALPLNGSANYSFGKWSYTVNKISMDECTQTNDNTSNQRDLRRILFDTVHQKRVVWQYHNDNGGWSAMDSNDLMVSLLKLATGQQMKHTRGKWNYIIAKVDDTHATQTNNSTNTVRQYRMIEKDKDEMDSNWSSKASTTNQSYVAGNQSNAGYGGMYGQLQYSNRLRGLFASLGAQDDDDADKPKEIVKLDPNDLQDIIMNADHDTDHNNNNNNKNEIDDLNDNEDDKEEDEEEERKQTERVLMGEEDRNIYNEFCKTMTKDSVQVLSIQKIKDNASKSIVYNALLSAKKEELKDKNVENIERVLFHGTSFENIAKIVNNGFNRDFNRHHLYGKGTYFSSLSSESAKYCENDDPNDTEKYVMLVCRVIIGEYTKGTHDMDGSSIPYKPDKKTQYESCVNHVSSPTIFVINRDYHAIPSHIITFKYKK